MAQREKHARTHTQHTHTHTHTHTHRGRAAPTARRRAQSARGGEMPRRAMALHTCAWSHTHTQSAAGRKCGSRARPARVSLCAVVYTTADGWRFNAATHTHTHTHTHNAVIHALVRTGEFAKAGRVVVAQRLGVAKRLEQRICVENLALQLIQRANLAYTLAYASGMLLGVCVATQVKPTAHGSFKCRPPVTQHHTQHHAHTPNQTQPKKHDAPSPLTAAMKRTMYLHVSVLPAPDSPLTVALRARGA